MTHFITTTDPARRATWLRLFGRDTLPVKQARPRWEWRQGAGYSDPFLTLVYDLDYTRLHQGDIDRLAGWISKRQGVSYNQARSMVCDGWTIPARGCEIVEPVEQEPSPAVLFMRILWTLPQQRVFTT